MTWLAFLVHLAGGLNPFGLRRATSVRISWTGGSESSYPARYISCPVVHHPQTGCGLSPHLPVFKLETRATRNLGAEISHNYAS